MSKASGLIQRLLAKCEADSEVAEIEVPSEVNSEVTVDSAVDSGMAKTKQTQRKRAGEFRCHVCGKISTQKCNQQGTWRSTV